MSLYLLEYYKSSLTFRGIMVLLWIIYPLLCLIRSSGHTEDASLSLRIRLRMPGDAPSALGTARVLSPKSSPLSWQLRRIIPWGHHNQVHIFISTYLSHCTGSSPNTSSTALIMSLIVGSKNSFIASLQCLSLSSLYFILYTLFS